METFWLVEPNSVEPETDLENEELRMECDNNHAQPIPPTGIYEEFRRSEKESSLN